MHSRFIKLKLSPTASDLLHKVSEATGLSTSGTAELIILRYLDMMMKEIHHDQSTGNNPENLEAGNGDDTGGTGTVYPGSDGG